MDIPRLAIALAALLAATPAGADTVFLKGGQKREGVVVCVDGDPVVVNPYNSRCPDMTWGISDKERFARSRVEKVEIADAPLVEYRKRASRPKLSADEHLDLAKFCEAHRLAEERDRELKLALCADPESGGASALLGRSVWAAWSRGNPLGDPELRNLEREYVQLGPDKHAEAQAQWDMMADKGSTRPRAYLERARRSARFQPGRRDKVPLTLRSEASPGATYAIYVPGTYDPLVPAGLVVGLHGGGPGGADPTLVTGSGESALDFYVDVAEAWGFIVVCPTALVGYWPDKRNEVLLDSVLDEVRLLYNVDEARLYVTGHSLGGFGAWHFGPKLADVWAAFAPCAGGGGPSTGGLPVYIYHGTDDNIVGCGSDRSSAESLRGAKPRADFVYTEIDKVGHGFPDWVRRDIFEFFAGRWRDDGKKRAVWPRSSFDRKVTKDEVKCFGDPTTIAAAANADDAKLSALVAALEKGGGRGLEAAKELATRKDPATVAAVGRVLHSKKASADSRVLAAKALGDLAMPECVKHLAAEASVDDFRVLDAVTEALGKLGAASGATGAFEPLARAAKQFGVFWDKSNTGGQFDFTEYEIRCQSFAGLCEAFAAARDPAAAAVIEKEVVARVYTPKTPYQVPVDYRFTQIPPRARGLLARSLAACLVKLADPRGKAILASVRDAWKQEPGVVGPCEEAISSLSR